MLSGHVKIPKFYFLLIIISVILGFIIYWYFTDTFDDNKKLETLASGLIVGLTILLTTLYLNKQEFDRTEALKRLEVLNVFKNRKDKREYGELIKSAQNEIVVLGVTASRMMNDFASDTDESCQELIQALDRGIIVKIMLSKEKHLEDQNRANLTLTTIPRILSLQKKYNNLEFKQYDGEANHSLFKVDNKCIVGPVFSGRSSKDSPSIVMKEKGHYVKPYIEYFNNIWEQANDYNHSAR